MELYRQKVYNRLEQILTIGKTMKIAILSDSHDHKENLKAALQQINLLCADILLLCGDMSASFMYQLAAKNFSNPIHAVFGNWEPMSFYLVKTLQEHSHLTHHDQYAALEFDGKTIGMTHYPFYAKLMAMSGNFDVVCFGHDHTQRLDTYDDCLAINPGALIGEGQPLGFAMYDTTIHQAELYTL